MVHAITIKKSRRRSMWQAKKEDHAVVSLHWVEPIIEEVLSAMSLDHDDRKLIVRFDFSDSPFDEATVQLERRDKSESPLWGRSNNLYGELYRIAWSSLGQLSAEGFIPPEITGFFMEAPQHLYLRLEPSSTRIFMQ